MIDEMKKSFNALLYERLTSPLSGILILSWLIFNWKICFVLGFGDDSIYKRISFVQTNYVNIKDNLYYPLAYAIGFILIYPWVTLGPFYIWQRSNFLKSKIKNKFELQTLLTLEQSIEIRQVMRQKESEFTEMLETKNTKQIELEAENKRLYLSIKDLEDKNNLLSQELHIKIGEIKGNENNVFDTAEERKWNSEYFEVYKKDGSFISYLEDVLEAIANKGEIDSDTKKYCLSQGLINIDINGDWTLSNKGRFLSKYTSSNWHKLQKK